MSENFSRKSPLLDPQNVESLQRYHAALANWWKESQRIFPWREAATSFHLLLSELMLRRTRADQVVQVYLEFIQKYPDPASLARADSEEVAAALHPLGLSWRIPAFQEISQILVDSYDGDVPSDYKSLTQLPGVGDYVASAICVFAFNRTVALVDTNTVRIAGRLFDIPTDAESRRRKPIRDLLNSLLDYTHPREYNYALLDLAALVCTPRKPDCPACPINEFCITAQ